MPLVLAILLFVLAVISAITGTVCPWFKAYHPNNVREFVILLISAAGWWLTFAGLLIAGKHALRGLTFQALLKLHEDEGNPKKKNRQEVSVAG